MSACLRLGWEVFIRAWRIEGYAFAAYEHDNELAVLWQWEVVALIFQSEVRACMHSPVIYSSVVSSAPKYHLSSKQSQCLKYGGVCLVLCFQASKHFASFVVRAGGCGMRAEIPPKTRSLTTTETLHEKRYAKWTIL